MDEENVTRAITPNGYWIVVLPTNTGLKGAERYQHCMIRTNDRDWIWRIEREIGDEQFGTQDELEARLKAFAEKHGLEFVRRKG